MMTKSWFKSIRKKLAHVRASYMRPEYVEYLITVDTHSPNRARVNAALPHIDVWYDAFKIKKGDKLLLAKKKRTYLVTHQGSIFDNNRKRPGGPLPIY